MHGSRSVKEDYLGNELFSFELLLLTHLGEDGTYHEDDVSNARTPPYLNKGGVLANNGEY
ncbi:MAG: hypothetical protein KUG64_09820 [Cycloclasticus sp.]|nr:hypothetical protein [Cycloclasticus sp.]